MESYEELLYAIKYTDLIEKLKSHSIYCKENKQEDWINELDNLREGAKTEIPFILRIKTESLIEAAKTMKMIANGSSWEEITGSFEPDENYDIKIPTISAIMIEYSIHGLDYTKSIIGSDIENYPTLLKIFNNELERRRKNLEK